MEVQIYGSDIQRRGLYCSAHLGVVSIFFSTSATETNDFFNWQAQVDAGETVTVDPSLLLSKIASTDGQTVTYLGSDTQPNCTLKYCWYGYFAPQTIGDAQLQWIKDKTGVEWNNRATNQFPFTGYVNTNSPIF